MLDINIICVGKLKEKFYTEAAAEYLKRLGAFCHIAITELNEARRSACPSAGDTDACLLKESAAIRDSIPKGAAIVAMCIEGEEMTSRGLSAELMKLASSGFSKLCFLIGGSDGLHDSLKAEARLRLSMSRMTFPHHLARVMLLEQLYRAFTIASGGKYHK